MCAGASPFFKTKGEKMHKRLCALLLALLLASVLGTAQGEEAVQKAAQEAAGAFPYTGVVSRELTVREEQSKSARKLESVEMYETIAILELGEEWVKIEKNGVTGYVLAKYVYNVTSSIGAPIPEVFAARQMDVPVMPDGETVLYTGVADIDLTMREKMSKSAKKLESVQAGETVDILELGDEWFYVIKNGVKGYILAKHVKQLTATMEDVIVPEKYIEAVEPEFMQLYTATATINLSVRKEMDRESKLLATVYEDEQIAVSTMEGEWALVRKGKQVGYVLSAYLKQFKAVDPYAALIPGVTVYPYAAALTREVTVRDASTGETLQTLPAGSVISVNEPRPDGSIELPYKRTTAVIAPEDMDALVLTPTELWEDCQPGELLCVFSTFFDPDETSELLEGRRYNMLEGVRRIGGTVLAPQERFSFNDLAAPYTQSNGYMKGPIINYTSSDKSGYGGGICQVSTTLYNAILQIPIKIVRSQPHSSVGIDYAPIDFDAAVGNGNIDLRFDNYLAYPIRIDAQMTNGVVTVLIYRNE